MAQYRNKIVKWIGLIVGSLAIVVLALGILIYTSLPAPIGEPPSLQHELFEKPSSLFPVNDSFIYASAATLAAMIKTGEASAEEIITAHIHHIKNNNYKLNAIVWLFEEEALAAARLADEMVSSGEPLGILHGVPVTVKEQYWVKGKPSTINSLQYGGFVAPRDAALVAALRNEGAIILGTTNIPIFLEDFQIEGELYPPGSNPYDYSRTPGGSSGGGAAALAAGFSPLELGSDMGGSIRIPSAFCGVYGLKPTEAGINDMDGAWPDDEALEYLALAVGGPMARTPEDVELMWNALIKTSSAPDRYPASDTSKRIEHYNIAWMDEWEFGTDKMVIGNNVKDKLSDLIATLNTLGVSAVKTVPDILVETKQMALLLYAYTFANNQPWIIRQFMKHEWGFYGYGRYDISEFLLRVSNPDPSFYPEILERRKRLTEKAELFFNDYDFLILPVSAGPAFKKQVKNKPIPLAGQSINYFDYLPYVEVFSATGHPSITIPLGLSEEGLPISVMVTGPLYSEYQLLHFAKLLSAHGSGFVKSTL